MKTKEGIQVNEIISIFALKGGVGKSACTLGLSGGLRLLGIPHLVIDLDPWSRTITSRCGLLDSHEDLRAVLFGRIELGGAIHKVNDLVSVIPASEDLYELEEAQELDLQPIFEELEEMENFKVILLDLPPGRSSFVEEALYSSDWILCPTKAESDSMVTLDITSKLVWKSKRTNPALRWLGVVVCLYRQGTSASKIMLKKLQRDLKGKIPLLSTLIPLATVVAESGMAETDPVTYAPRSKVGERFVQLTKEIMDITGVNPKDIVIDI
jgi:chromosome partitioning protein